MFSLRFRLKSLALIAAWLALQGFCAAQAQQVPPSRAVGGGSSNPYRPCPP